MAAGPMRWFRFYSEAAQDPKVQSLPVALRWRWVEVLCLASRSSPRGVLPPLRDVSYALRCTESRCTQMLEKLQRAGLLEYTERGLEPHNWDGRQYDSDTSTPRVQRFRERSREQDGNVSVTANETPPEVEERRGEAEAETELYAEDTYPLSSPKGDSAKNGSAQKRFMGARSKRDDAGIVHQTHAQRINAEWERQERLAQAERELTG